MPKQAEDVPFSRSSRNPDDLTERKEPRKKPKDSLEEEQGEMIPSSVSDGGGVSSSKDFVWPSDSLIAEHWTEKPEMEPDGEPETASSSHAGIREQSFRSGNIRGHPSDTSAFLESVAETSHLRKKRLVQEYARKERGKPEGTDTMEDFREEIKGKVKREQIQKEQKKAGRLSFGDEDNGMVRGAGMGISKKAVSAAAGSAAVYVHGKAHEAEQENAAMEGTHRAELMAESALRYTMHRTSRGMHKRNARLQESEFLEKGTGRLLHETAQEAVEKQRDRRQKTQRRQKGESCRNSGRNANIKRHTRQRKKERKQRREQPKPHKPLRLKQGVWLLLLLEKAKVS